MAAYYNEFDPFAAEWLRELIKEGHIAPGDVDERSIVDVRPADLAGYGQCHFFAGIGVWSLALRGAGWADDRPVWTGSCPCQPFSAAGKGGGFNDERHLWPAFFDLIRECRPDVVLGEQVASKDGLAWLDLVSSDLEGADYAVGAVDTCAAGFGAPHIRQRLYWAGIRQGGESPRRSVYGRPGKSHGMALPDHAERRPDLPGGDDRDGPDAGWPQGAGHAGARGGSGGLADTQGDGHERAGELGEPAGRNGAAHGGADERMANADGREYGHGDVQLRGQHRLQSKDGSAGGSGDRGAWPDAGPGLDRPGPTNGLWAAADWLGCRDGKWRPVEPGTFPLAHAGAYRNRVGLLRGAGNAVNLAQAQGFAEAVMEAL